MSERDLLLQSLFGKDDEDDSAEDDGSVSSHDCPMDQKIDSKSLPKIEKRSNATRTTTGTPPIPKDIHKQNHQPVPKEAGKKRKRDSISLSPPPFSTNSDTINNWRQQIQIFDNVLTRDECDELIAIHHSEPHTGYIHGLKVTRIIDLVLGERQQDNNDDDDASSPSSIPLVLPLLQARYKVWEIVETKAFPELELEILPEYTALTSWHKGSVLKPHYDSNKEYLKDRHYSALLYLNDPLPQQQEEETTTSRSNNGFKHHHPKNYHKNGFSGGDLVFEVPPHVLDSKNNNSKDGINRSNSNNTMDDKQVRIRPRAGRLVCFPACKDYVHGVETIVSGTRYALTMWFTKHTSALESLESVQHIRVARVKNRHNNNVARFLAPRGFPQRQPWETPKQAEALRLQILADAGLPKPPQQHKDQHPPTLVVAKSKLVELNESQVVHLIAFCWWKQGRSLADLVESAVPLHAPGNVEAVSQQPDAAAVAAPSLQSPSSSQRQLWRFEWKDHNDEATNDTNFGYFFHHQWQTLYLSSRSRGLASALHRWKREGMITSVQDNEMKIG